MVKNRRKIDAVFVPALCLSWNGKKLSSMCEQSVFEAVKYAKKFNSILILSNSNLKLGETEKNYKENILKKIKFNLSKTIYIMPEEEVTNTYEEIERLLKLNKLKKFRTIAVVGEQWHMPRTILALNRKIQGVNFLPLPFKSRKYGPLNTKPSLKGLFASTKLSWIIYNSVSYLLAPLLVRRN